MFFYSIKLNIIMFKTSLNKKSIGNTVYNFYIYKAYVFALALEWYNVADISFTYKCNYSSSHLLLLFFL